MKLEYFVGFFIALFIFWMIMHWRLLKKKQTTFVYCSCGNELVADSDNSFIEDTYVKERNVVQYKCSVCGENSFWDFDHPTVLRLPLTSTDTIIDDYKKQRRAYWQHN